eukprot:7686770-Pyramimonas_sp.AAC.1
MNRTWGSYDGRRRRGTRRFWMGSLMMWLSFPWIVLVSTPPSGALLRFPSISNMSRCVLRNPFLVAARPTIQEESVVTSRRPRLKRAAARSLGQAMCAHRPLQAMLIRNLTPFFAGYRPFLDQSDWSAIQELLRL